MALNFPTSPALNEYYSYNDRVWKWNGYAWSITPASAGTALNFVGSGGISTSINGNNVYIGLTIPDETITVPMLAQDTIDKIDNTSVVYSIALG